MNFPLGSSGPEELLFTPFGEGIEVDEISLPISARRRRPITFSPAPAVATVAPFDPLTVLEREAEALFLLHPYQSETSREGAVRFLEEYQAMLLGLTGFPVIGAPAARRVEVFDHLTALFGGRIVRVLTRMETAFDAAPAVVVGADGEIEDLDQLGVANVVLVSPAVIEAMGTRIGPFLERLRESESLIGVGVADLRWFAAGFSPARLGFDFIVADLSLFLPEGGEHYLTLFEEGIVPPGGLGPVEGWFRHLDSLVRIDCQLRRLGASGLRRLAEEAAIRSAFLQTQLRRHDPELCLGGTLLDVFLRSVPPVRIESSESKAELLGLAVQFSICQ